jgi:hypothetical protein
MRGLLPGRRDRLPPRQSIGIREHRVLHSIEPGANPDTSGLHWYCDAVAVDFREPAVHLCEISYSKSLSALLKRLDGWNANWTLLRAALIRDCAVPPEWPVRPWVFVPRECCDVLAKGLTKFLGAGAQMPRPKITELEDAVPWKYQSWNRLPEREGNNV